MCNINDHNTNIYIYIYGQGHLGCTLKPKSFTTVRCSTNLKNALEEWVDLC